MIFTCPNCKNNVVLIRARRVKPKDLKCPGCNEVIISDLYIIIGNWLTDSTVSCEVAEEKGLLVDVDF